MAVEKDAGMDASAVMDSEEISTLAYSLWQARGCPEGSPEEDWFNAERELRKTSTTSTRTQVRKRAQAAGDAS